MQFGGEVRTASGNPIPGARVELHVDGKQPRPAEVAVSSATGQYKFFASSCPCDFSLEIVATAPGYEPFHKSLSGRAANKLETLNIVLLERKTS
jgi:hypothetical protein